MDSYTFQVFRWKVTSSKVIYLTKIPNEWVTCKSCVDRWVNKKIQEIREHSTQIHLKPINRREWEEKRGFFLSQRKLYSSRENLVGKISCTIQNFGIYYNILWTNQVEYD